ncbi:hypothetical protein A2634_05210 [Candidatus Amesbacteria bacterium RIFCSPHIGHO2_01_FULL_48_32]|uniref:Uncharacterized protein n=1 Tax=Candidatus Amesbacteria bacterium RIFCSPLOWO2_01_FULL_48_25 TaxID=1797259 RepID=A0A1F4ZEJ7_9BACT|nr:MAG: hypothetical protein A2634_05210 [Candidatus Amesbacteria bacterium RIFCSPHIGHO2_01_FULL_48_32]OGD04067.1 MAG: hypothetical protein A2989_01555 [Candidatus Amesbacteria bacterium RIFCSPLOWO2_01_FULL_48_25]HJZ05669.1 hypothetical protein [Patescibacteria group bacterium]
MLGTLIKFGIIAAIVASIGGFIYLRRGSLPQIPQPKDLLSKAKSTVQSIDAKILAQNISVALDNLITHPDKNSPVVLGVKITNDSLKKLVEVIQTLPPDQVDQLKAVVCATATPSGK